LSKKFKNKEVVLRGFSILMDTGAAKFCDGEFLLKSDNDVLNLITWLSDHNKEVIFIKIKISANKLSFPGRPIEF
jgi:hypothetical protein